MCNDFLSTLTFIYNQFICSLHCISHTYIDNLENGGHMLTSCCQNIATYMHHKILCIATYIYTPCRTSCHKTSYTKSSHAVANRVSFNFNQSASKASRWMGQEPMKTPVFVWKWNHWWLPQEIHISSSQSYCKRIPYQKEISFNILSIVLEMIDGVCPLDV